MVLEQLINYGENGPIFIAYILKYINIELKSSM